MTRHLSIDAAAQALGVSRKTVERRLKSGTLTGHLAGRRWLVDVPDEVLDGSHVGESETESGQSETGQPRQDMSQTVAALQAELAVVHDERDYLRQTVDRLLSTNAMLVQKLESPALPPPPGPENPPPVSPTRRRWRWPWDRA